MRNRPVILAFFLLFLIGFISASLMYVFGAFDEDILSLRTRKKIGIIQIEGIITDTQDIVDQIKAFSDDKNINAIVLRINSPGGGVVPSQEIYQAVHELKKKKKVVVSMGSIAASGGYLIAVAADRIFANPGTITGSISAVMHYANLEELLKKIGVRSNVVKSGKFKDIGSPVREMTSEEKVILQQIVDDIYEQFVDTISENRKLSREAVRRLADGRIFSGRQAKKLGLVDELGSLHDAVSLAAKLSGIEGKPVVVYGIKKKKNILKYLIESIKPDISNEFGVNLQESWGAQYIFR